MGAAKYAFGFLSIALLGSAAAMVLTDTGGVAPISIGACGVIAAVVAWNIDRWIRPEAESRNLNDPGDIALPRHDAVVSSNHSESDE
jgi:hypothetical protein